MSWGTEAESGNEPDRAAAGEYEPDDETLALFDVEELNIDWPAWLPDVDYTATIRRAKAGEAVLRHMLRRIRHRGSRVRTQCLATREGEPVVRVDLHPDGWREVAELVADGARYRRREPPPDIDAQSPQ